jgi:hypothetical protein
VENGLDAAEEVGVLPDIVVRVDRVPDHVIGDLYGHKLSKAKAKAKKVCAGQPQYIGLIA